MKEKMWGKKEIEIKRKLVYYKENINLNMEDQNDLSILSSLKDKINIDKIKMISKWFCRNHDAR